MTPATAPEAERPPRPRADRATSGSPRRHRLPPCQTRSLRRTTRVRGGATHTR
ncbi:hypothetical protein STRAU_1747 [Streptomyces aurantiacus JA 4570]|uniref:Uncharacterized protein n=1 Tax=Streptomyces aurantiacus JA 4570 TaxID=1286094 RepID=S3ZQP8_9ACTN|nr:hypothetical protein STRAU_1747 [Streptomyces aurantiacus JA 4570]